MSLITPHIGIQMGDVASAMVGKTFYRAYSWVNVRTNSVVVSIYTEQEHGQEVLVRTDTLMQAEREDGDLDSPKLIAVGSTLVLHWVAGLDLARKLHRATFDLTAIQGTWTNHGSIDTHETGLYDVAASGHPTDFVLVDRTLDGEGWAAYRVTAPYGWLDFAWIDTYKPGMADRVLACYELQSDLHHQLETRRLEEMEKQGRFDRGMQVMDTVGSVIGGVGGAVMSDANSKQKLQAGNMSASQAVGELEPVSFEYKPGFGEPGQRVGIVAQDLEKTPAGQTIVKQTPYGKAVDIGGMSSLALASTADQEQLKRIPRFCDLREKSNFGANAA